MADNQVVIAIVTKAELEDAESLDALIDEIRDKLSDGIDLNLQIDDVQSELDEVNAQIEDLQNQQVEIEMGVSDADFDEVSAQLEEATARAEELEAELETLNGMVVSPDIDTSGIEEASTNLDSAASSMDNLTTAAAGIGAAAGIEQMVTTADNINTSWNRLELTFANTGVSMDTLKEKASAASDATGRSGATVRDYFNQMGIAGVTNTELLSSSFEALSGKAYQTGNDIATMESKMQTMAMTGNASSRMLKQLGIDADDLAAAMGVTADEVSNAFKEMTPEERIAAITQAMGDGAAANDMYKNSYAGLKDRADAAMAGLAGAVGQAILPIVVPALQAATNFINMLSDGFKALPAPVQGVIGALGGMVAIVTTAIGVMGIIGTVFNTVKTGLEALNLVTYAKAAADQVAAAAQWLLNAAMDANPIGILIIAITALIAILGYLYFNNEQVRAAVDWLGQSFLAAGQIIIDSFTSAVNFVIGVLQNLWNYIMTLGGLIPANASITGNQVIDAALKVLIFFSTMPLQLAMHFTNMIAQALGFGSNFSQRLISGAVNAVNGFINKIRELPGMIQSEFARIEGIVSNFITSLPQRVWDLGASIVGALKSALGIGSPGHMYWMFEGELTRLKNAPEDMKGNITSSVKDLGSSMTRSFSPQLDYNITGTTSSNSTTADNNAGSVRYGDVIINVGTVDNEQRIQEIVEAVRKELSWNNKTAGRTV